MDISPAASGIFTPSPVQHAFQLDLGGIFIVVVVTVILTVTIYGRMINRRLKDKEIEDRLKQLENVDRVAAMKATPVVTDAGVTRSAEQLTTKVTSQSAVVPPPAVGAAPAQHTKSERPQARVAPVTASPEVVAEGSPRAGTEVIDDDASILSGQGAPIAPGAGEAVAAYLRSQAQSA